MSTRMLVSAKAWRHLAFPRLAYKHDISSHTTDTVVKQRSGVGSLLTSRELALMMGCGLYFLCTTPLLGGSQSQDA